MKYKKTLSSSERLDELLRFIEASKHVSVSSICEQFNISEATARRDLDTLSEQGKIQRVHGGAIALRNPPPENPVYQRLTNQAENKKRIGMATAKLIEPGETVFLGSGTTVLEVAKCIEDRKDLTVITNSLLVINQLISYQNITLIDLGGLVRSSELSMIGHIAEDTLEGLYADKVIIGIHGIDLEQGLTNHYLPETVTDRKILKMGRKIIVVVDHTKCGVISTAHVAPISVIDTLVTDTEAPQEFVKAVGNSGVTVIQV